MLLMKYDYFLFYLQQSLFPSLKGLKKQAGKHLFSKMFLKRNASKGKGRSFLQEEEDASLPQSPF